MPALPASVLARLPSGKSRSKSFMAQRQRSRTSIDDGANGIRTRDLLAASQTLSQLSYGPWSARILATRRDSLVRAVGARALATDSAIDAANDSWTRARLRTGLQTTGQCPKRRARSRADRRYRDHDRADGFRHGPDLLRDLRRPRFGSQPRRHDRVHAGRGRHQQRSFRAVERGRPARQHAAAVEDGHARGRHRDLLRDDRRQLRLDDHLDGDGAQPGGRHLDQAHAAPEGQRSGDQLGRRRQLLEPLLPGQHRIVPDDRQHDVRDERRHSRRPLPPRQRRGLERERDRRRRWKRVDPGPGCGERPPLSDRGHRNELDHSHERLHEQQRLRDLQRPHGREQQLPGRDGLSASRSPRPRSSGASRSRSSARRARRTP